MAEATVHSFGAVILAAGGSTRMGRPKQLLPIEGVSLARRAANAALASKAWPVVVVLGNAAPLIQMDLAKLPLLFAVNKSWADGIGSSIRLGIQTLDMYSASLVGAIVLLADQPNLSAEAIDAIADAAGGVGVEVEVGGNRGEGVGIRGTLAAARYGGVIGAPAFFPRAYFPELLALDVAEGAQKILRRHADRVVAVERPELAVDLDTPEEVQRFLEGRQGFRAPPPR
ncbi:MAG TPA: nucleotidyltransferase family protein [Opitutaceae bacterium]|nr:nucleotidyltransferase family protein [Opitutaceae bacterium]